MKELWRAPITPTKYESVCQIHGVGINKCLEEKTNQFALLCKSAMCATETFKMDNYDNYNGNASD